MPRRWRLLVKILRVLFEKSSSSRVVFEMKRREQFEDISLLRAHSVELCLAIVGMSWARNHLLERMLVAAICHIEMVGELATFGAAVTSATELVLGCSLDETFWVEIMDELVAQFQKLEELCSRLEQPDARICDLLLELPPNQAR
jgi:hypothetical protein